MKYTSISWTIFPLITAFIIISAFTGALVTSVEALKAGQVAFISGMAFAASAVLSIIISNITRKPLKEISQGAARFALGLFDKPIDGGMLKETAEIAENLNIMSAELKVRISAGANEAQTGEAVLTCLKEGILAVDANLVILKINPVARHLLDIPSAKIEGLSIRDVVYKRSELLNFIDEGLETRKLLSKEMSIEDSKKKIIQVIQSPLHKSNGEYWGQVMSLNDVTRLRQLESLRRDFAANVSHELRTPITSIQGAVEALLSGAVEDPETADRFLQMLDRQVKRLSGIIEDLLTLSRIENENVISQGFIEHVSIKNVLEKIISDLSYKSAEKNINVKLACPDNLEATISVMLLERALANLLDNSINYSDPGKEVLISVFLSENVLSIHVRDQGFGIDGNHLDRIFERFYRVDTSRSRKLGGTGLGLSIVKHSIIAHGGKVTVESVPGEGSVFSIHIPVKKIVNFKKAIA
ncbi:MAG TPA: sensor histidine kinase [Nitrospirae bacterium]|nr:sensor histidine kinase [Nitrospirota bacterium]